MNWGLAPRLRSCRELYPGVEVIATQMPVGDQVDALRDDTIDVGFTMADLGFDHLVVRHIAEERAVVVLPEDHELAQARLDRLPTTSRHRCITRVLPAGTFFDAFDSLVLGVALTVIAKSLGQGFLGTGLLISAGYVEQALGALFLGSVSERIGRRRAFLAAIGVFSLLSIGCALAWNLEALTVARLLQGLGLGAEMIIELRCDARFSCGIERTRFVPKGLFGGRPAAPNEVSYTVDGAPVAPGSGKVDGVELSAGDVITIRTGGGCWGDQWRTSSPTSRPGTCPRARRRTSTRPCSMSRAGWMRQPLPGAGPYVSHRW